MDIKGFSPDQVERALREFDANPYAGRHTIAKALGIGIGQARRLAHDIKEQLGRDPSSRQNVPSLDTEWTPVETSDDEHLKIDEREGALEVEGRIPMNRYSYAETVEHLLDAAEIDTDLWQVTRKVINRWGGRDNPHWQVKAWLKPAEDDLYQQMIEAALETLKDRSPIVHPFNLEAAGTRQPEHRRALEISIMDPHLGGIFYPPASEHAWSLESCRDLWQYGIQEVLNRAAPYGPYERILFFFGNDFMHADNVFHTTTAGTEQPEMAAIHHCVEFGEKMLIDTLNGLAEIVPDVDVLFVPGNHARWTEFMMARVLLHRFHNHEGVHVQAGPEPYKAWRYGVNLVAGEHGHSAKTRSLPGLMANEWARWWYATEGGYREWHLGDQHRQGKILYEEQGVSVQGLPGLTPANEWHKIKAFNHQKRVAATGFVWDFTGAKHAELPICLDGKTGAPFV